MLREKKLTIIVSIAILLFSSIYYLSYYKYLRLTNDEGFLLDGAMRVLSGEVPHKDFTSYPPGRYYLLANAFRLFGASVKVERLVWLVLHCLVNVLMYLAAKRIMPIPFALIPVFIIMVVPGPWHKTLVAFLLLLNLLMIHQYVEHSDRRWLVISGLVVGFSVWFRQDIAAFSALTMVAYVVLRSLLHSIRSGRWSLLAKIRAVVSESFSELFVYSCTVVLSLLPLCLFYWVHSGLSSLIYGAVIQVPRVAFSVSSPFPSLLLLLTAQPTRRSRSEILFLYVVLLMLVVLALLVLFQTIRKMKNGDATYKWILLSTLVLAILFFRVYTWPWSHVFRLPQSGAVIYILGGYIIYRVYSHVSHFIAYQTRRGEIGSMVGIVVTLMLLAFAAYYVGYSLLMQSRMGGGTPLSNDLYVPIDSPRAGTYLPEMEAKDLNGIINYVGAHTIPQDTIFAFNHAALYFLVDRRNATRDDEIFAPLVVPWVQEQFLDDFRKNSPTMIIARPEDVRRFLTALPSFLDEISQKYEFDRTIGGCYIFRKGGNLSSPYSSMGTFYQIAGEVEDAVVEYRKALAIDAKDQVAQRHLAGLLISETRRALPVFEGYVVWENDGEWHVRWGGENRHRFHGRISCSSGFSEVKPYPTEDKDGYRRSREVITFDTKVKSSVKGLDFMTVGVCSVVFDIQIDGAREISKVLIGAEGESPREIPFALH